MASIQLDELRKLKEPGKFFGGGLLAGVGLFLLWLVMQPAVKETASVEPAAGAEQAQQVLGADQQGVLGGITGGLEPGAVREYEEEVMPPDAAVDGNAEAVAGEAAAPPSDEQSIAQGMLSGAEAAPQLRTYQVEVARGPGVTEVLVIDAKSPQHVLDIVRDYRGNPKVLGDPELLPPD